MRAPIRLLPTAIVLLISACSSGPSAQECARPSRDLVKAIQDYVDGYAKITPARFATDSDAPSPRQLALGVARYREQLRLSRCDVETERENLVAGLATLKGKGVVGGAIAASLRQSLTRAARFGDTPPQPETLRLRPGSDLATAAVAAIPGSTIVLARGTYKIDTPLVLLDDITIKGGGRDTTKIVSSAAGASLLFLSNGTLVLEGVAITSAGGAASSLVVVRAGSYVIRDSRVTGAKRDKKGTGGAGLVVGAVKSQEKDRTMRIERTEFTQNQTSGITVGGNDAPIIARVVITGSKSCGICYIGSAGGFVRDSRLQNNTTGVTVTSGSGPTLRGNLFASNRIGIQARGKAHPVLIGNRFRSNRSAAGVFTEKATGSGRANTCSGSTFGFVVLESARPTFSGNGCPVFRED